jgi:hypothetical protein
LGGTPMPPHVPDSVRSDQRTTFGQVDDTPKRVGRQLEAARGFDKRGSRTV